MFAQNPKSLTLGQIVDNTGASSTRLRAVFEIFGSLHDGQSRRLGCPWLPFAAATQARTVPVLARATADVNVINLHRACQRLLARHQKAESVTHAPSGRLADPDRLGQSNRGDALIRLQNKPKPGEPHTKRQLGGMQRRLSGDGELVATRTARALIEAGAAFSGPDHARPTRATSESRLPDRSGRVARPSLPRTNGIDPRLKMLRPCHPRLQFQPSARADHQALGAPCGSVSSRASR